MTDTVVNLPAPTAPQRREVQTVIDAVPILDTARFEHMQRIAKVMACSSMIPETLRTTGPKENKQDLPFEQVLSNCFLVVNQAARWGMDPFAVISCCAVVHGRLSYEGKLVAAVLDAKLGIELHHHFTGNPAGEDFRIYLSDQPFTPELIAELKPGFSKNGWRIFDGSVAEWKTTGAGSPWSPKNYKRMLIYRGTRDWARIYKSAIMLGVYSDDEMIDLMEDARARRSTPVASLAERLAAAKLSGPASDGFSQDHVTRETGDASNTEAQRDAAGNQPPPASTADEALASDQGTSADVPGEVQDRSESTSPPDSNSSEQPQQASPLAALADAPAVESRPPPEAAGNQSESSRAEHAGDGEAQAGAASPGGAGLPSTLPEGWGITYAAALRRAQSKTSLAKLATQYWSQYGGWPKHKDGPDAPTAIAIYDAFTAHFGNKEAIEEALREII